MPPEIEFTAEGVLEGFGSDPFFASLLAENDVTPEEFAAYLNDVFDQSDRQALYAMFEDHDVDLDVGGEASVREIRSFEEWAERTGFDPEEEEP
jgi:hypothetical protein